MVAENKSENERFWGLRRAIYDHLLKSQVSRTMAERILSQCAAGLRDTDLVETVARTAGFVLSGYNADSALEFYYDVKQGERNVGYISKGWTDPGFRIGEFLNFNAEAIQKFRAGSDSILNLCSSQLVSCGARFDHDGLVLDLTIPIYEGGFNAQTMKAAFDHVSKCADTIREIVLG